MIAVIIPLGGNLYSLHQVQGVDPGFGVGPPGTDPGYGIGAGLRPGNALPGAPGTPGNELPAVPPPTVPPNTTLVLIRSPDGKWSYATVPAGSTKPIEPPAPAPKG